MVPRVCLILFRKMQSLIVFVVHQTEDVCHFALAVIDAKPETNQCRRKEAIRK